MVEFFKFCFHLWIFFKYNYNFLDYKMAKLNVIKEPLNWPSCSVVSASIKFLTISAENGWGSMNRLNRLNIIISLELFKWEWIVLKMPYPNNNNIWHSFYLVISIFNNHTKKLDSICYFLIINWVLTSFFVGEFLTATV